MYLEREEFELAKEYCRDNPPQHILGEQQTYNITHSR
jgi:hypothetical protein